jgi:hypothetical protein
LRAASTAVLSASQNHGNGISVDAMAWIPGDRGGLASSLVLSGAVLARCHASSPRHGDGRDQAVREKSVSDIEDVHAVILEIDGAFSVIAGGQPRVESALAMSSARVDFANALELTRLGVQHASRVPKHVPHSCTPPRNQVVLRADVLVVTRFRRTGQPRSSEL